MRIDRLTRRARRVEGDARPGSQGDRAIRNARLTIKAARPIAVGLAAVLAGLLAIQVVWADDSPVWNPARPLSYGSTDPVVPQPPSIGDPLAAESGVTVRWTAPTDEGSFLVTHYAVESVPESYGCLVERSTECFVSSLELGTPYVFRVQALNGAGWSGWSAWSSPVSLVSKTAPTVSLIGRWGTRGIELEISSTGHTPGALATIYVRRDGQFAARPLPGRYTLDAQGNATVRIRQKRRSPVYVIAVVNGVRSPGIWIR